MSNQLWEFEGISHIFTWDFNHLVITMADVEKILKCWDPIDADPNAFGGEILSRLFKEHPETLKSFPKFVNIPPADLAGNPAVLQHGGVVMRKLSEILKAKGNHGPILNPLAASHAKTHKVPLNNFRLITEIIAKVLGERGILDAAGQNSLRNVMTSIIAEMEVTYKEVGFQG
ncbi:myoglobin [Arapaima gigas]